MNGAHRRPAIFTDYPRIAVHAHSYLMALQKRGAPLLKHAAWNAV